MHKCQPENSASFFQAWTISVTNSFFFFQVVSVLLEENLRSGSTVQLRPCGVESRVSQGYVPLTCQWPLLKGVRTFVRACVRAFVRVRVCVCVCVSRACACVCVHVRVHVRVCVHAGGGGGGGSIVLDMEDEHSSTWFQAVVSRAQFCSTYTFGVFSLLLTTNFCESANCTHIFPILMKIVQLWKNWKYLKFLWRLAS